MCDNLSTTVTRSTRAKKKQYLTHTQKSLANGPASAVLGGSFLEKATLSTSPGALMQREALRGTLKSHSLAVSSSDPLSKQAATVTAVLFG